MVLKARLETSSSQFSLKRCYWALSTRGSAGFNLHRRTVMAFAVSSASSATPSANRSGAGGFPLT